MKKFRKTKMIVYDPEEKDIKFIIYVKTREEAETFCRYFSLRIEDDDIRILE